MPFCVAVCGGIASGKSSLCSWLENAGAALFDADIIARELVMPGAPALHEITQHLGPQFISENGNLDRAALRAHVFADPSAKQVLEGILHPRIQAELFKQSRQTASPYAIIAIPLLTPETRITSYAWLNRVLVVEAPEHMQLTRIMARDGNSAALAKAMVAAQLNFSERLPMADDVIINDADLANLRDWANRLHVRYLHEAEVDQAVIQGRTADQYLP